jgi:cystathionine beta-lyase/cystathionine gamma-synthase
LYQRPIECGIDLVLQSATKYINGHSDVVAGVLSGTKAMVKKIFSSEYMNMGIGTTPFNAWLLIRGLRTLQVRLSRISDTTEKVINYLKNLEKVEDLMFPFDKDFPQYDLAKKQMNGACGLFSFYLKTDSIKEIENFCESLQHIIMAVSWGGYESLIMPNCASVKEGDFDANNKDQRKLRMYVGLEDPQYIIEDLERGFKSMSETKV